MAERITAVKGMNDLLPEGAAHWERVEAVLRGVLHAAIASHLGKSLPRSWQMTASATATPMPVRKMTCDTGTPRMPQCR